MLKGGGVLKSSYKRTNFPIPWCVLLKFRTNACLPSSIFNACLPSSIFNACLPSSIFN